MRVVGMDKEIQCQTNITPTHERTALISPSFRLLVHNNHPINQKVRSVCSLSSHLVYLSFVYRFAYQFNNQPAVSQLHVDLSPETFMTGLLNGISLIGHANSLSSGDNVMRTQNACFCKKGVSRYTPFAVKCLNRTIQLGNIDKTKDNRDTHHHFSLSIPLPFPQLLLVLDNTTNELCESQAQI